ncbi:MAG: hypothetical protein AAF945_21410 [Actinomycetota bacterium]
MAAELDESRHPVVVLRTGAVDSQDEVDALVAAFTRLFEIGPVGLALEWGRVGRDARRQIAEFRSSNDDSFRAAVRCTASIVAPAVVEANRAKAADDPARADRAWYASTEAEAVDWVTAWLAENG